MSKSSVYLPRVSDPVVVENCHPQKYYLISTNDISIRVGSNIWSKIRDHYTRAMKDNPNQDFIPYELYLNKEKQFKMTGIERKNYGMEIKFHITDIISGTNYIIDFHKDIINVESREYHEKRKKYLEENKQAYCIDKTNLTDDYTRNKIRNHILPYVDDNIVKGSVSHIYNTANLLRQQEDYLEEEMNKIFSKIVKKGENSFSYKIDRKEFLKLHVFMQKKTSDCSEVDDYRVRLCFSRRRRIPALASRQPAAGGTKAQLAGA